MSTCACKLPCLSLPVRLALGGLLLFSGWLKLGLWNPGDLHASLHMPMLTPLDFFFSIKAFKLGTFNLGSFELGFTEDVMRFMAFAIPWTELFAGLALVLGLWARAAAIVVVLMMLSFIAGIVSLQVRGIDADCTCFGSLKLFCGPGAMGSCHIIRNSIFALAALAVATLGPGPLALSRRA